MEFFLQLWFSMSYIKKCYRRPLIFQTLNSSKSNSLRLKYQSCTLYVHCTAKGCNNVGIRQILKVFLVGAKFLKSVKKAQPCRAYNFGIEILNSCKVSQQYKNLDV